MATKNLGHYEGFCEEPNSLKDKLLLKKNKLHNEAYQLAKTINELESQLKPLKERMNEIRSLVLNDLKEGKSIDWAWLWQKNARIAWKEEFIRANGIDKANAITKANTKNKVDQVGIKYVDPLPDSIILVKPNPKR
jgi:hypothetical protein